MVTTNGHEQLLEAFKTDLILECDAHGYERPQFDIQFPGVPKKFDIVCRKKPKPLERIKEAILQYARYAIYDVSGLGGVDESRLRTFRRRLEVVQTGQKFSVDIGYLVLDKQPNQTIQNMIRADAHIKPPLKIRAIGSSEPENELADVASE